MKKIHLPWTLSHAATKDGARTESIPATVPGAVQLDYAREKNYAPYYYGLNFKQFDWMEDEFFFYETTLDFSCGKGEQARLIFEGIDYKYDITLDGLSVAAGEGAFTPVVLDVTAYAGRAVALCVTLYPIPKRVAQPQNRVQASASCKPPSSYTWDWHPRLVPSGIWKEAYLDIVPEGSPRDLQVSYVLKDDLSSVCVKASVTAYGDGKLTAELIAPCGMAVCAQTVSALNDQTVDFTLSLDAPQLWYPRGYGEQPIYTLRVTGGDGVERKLGFRRSKLILGGAKGLCTPAFPMGPEAAPMQLEINGKKVFAKGSNWVNTEIFPCLATKERYDELIELAYDANMNIFRLWGGQYINHDSFYEKCDEMGMMVWQEFMLSCNLYPDSEDYLAVLTQEARSIVRTLRSHPCIAFWCGGNELFNSWSGLTCQSHALRLLDKICYEEDRQTPFNMTSPLHGVGHGSYLKVVFPNNQPGHEFIRDVKAARCTAYTEFGCNGGASRDYILKYIMDEKNYNDCNENNDIWREHHAFRAWTATAWLGVPEVEYFFGGYRDVDDLMDKSLYLQAMCYSSMFEEMRRQAPVCSMAINWDFNEPWPCAAGNSLVNWPAEPKAALTAVKQSLRPTLASLDIPNNRYLTGETLTGCVWVLNDNETEAAPTTVTVSLVSGERKIKLADIATESVASRKNGKFGTFELPITADIAERFAISLECEGHPEWDSIYSLVHNTVLENPTTASGEDRDSNDFSDFLK